MGLTVTFKGIKPQRLKVDAITEELMFALQEEGREHIKQLKRTVATWRKKPEFEYLLDIDPSEAVVISGPVGDLAQKWEWLDRGVRPHIIAARRKPRLAFKTRSFRAKTKPGRISAFRGRAARPPWAFPKKVRHPGIEARRWSELLSKRRKRPFQRRIIKAMQDGAKKVF